MYSTNKDYYAIRKTGGVGGGRKKQKGKKKEKCYTVELYRDRKLFS